MNFIFKIFQSFKNFYQDFDKLLYARGLACIVVVLSHTAPPPGGVMSADRLQDLTWLYAYDGPAAVNIFFVLSGYLMSKAFYTNRYNLNWTGIKAFFISRAKRIIPLYYFVTLILVVLFYPNLFRFSNLETLSSILFFYYHYDFHTAKFATSFWSLAVEVQYYVLVPIIMYFLIKILKKGWIFLILISGLVAFMVNRVYFTGRFFTKVTEFYFKYPLVASLEIFFLGMMIYPLLINFPKVRKFLSYFSWLAVLTLPIVFIVGAYNNYYAKVLIGNGNLIIPAFVAAVFVYLVEAGEIDTTFKRKVFSLGKMFKNPLYIFEFLGVISYGMYLWHMPILQSIDSVWYPTGFDQHRYIQSLPVKLGLTIILATATYYLVEIPGSKIGSKLRS